LLLLSSTFVLGLRHGVDWDHVAAIADLTAAQPQLSKGLTWSALYAVGHALMVTLLGIGAVVLGALVPGWVDQIMEPLVGVTLILLSIWLAWSLVRDGIHFRLRSRTSMLCDALDHFRLQLLAPVRASSAQHIAHRQRPVGVVGSLVLGAVHGIGAETPTQVLAFVAAASARGTGMGMAVLGSFVLGMFLSNMAVAWLAICGYRTVRGRQFIYRGLGMATAALSFGVGLVFLCGQARALPALAGI